MAGWSACCDGGDHEVSRDKETTVSCLCENGKKRGIYFREMGVLSFSKVSFHFSGFETGTFEGCSTRSFVHSGVRKDQRRIGW